MVKKLYLSHSPASKKQISGRWCKSVKSQRGIGGKIVANAFGDTREEAEDAALFISLIPEMLEAIKYVADWDSFRDHPISSKAREVLKKIPIS